MKREASEGRLADVYELKSLMKRVSQPHYFSRLLFAVAQLVRDKKQQPDQAG